MIFRTEIPISNMNNPVEGAWTMVSRDKQWSFAFTVVDLSRPVMDGTEVKEVILPVTTLSLTKHLMWYDFKGQISFTPLLLEEYKYKDYLKRSIVTEIRDSSDYRQLRKVFYNEQGRIRIMAPFQFLNPNVPLSKQQVEFIKDTIPSEVPPRINFYETADRFIKQLKNGKFGYPQFVR